MEESSGWKWLVGIVGVLMIIGLFSEDEKEPEIENSPTPIVEQSPYQTQTYYDGYSWAENNSATSFDECQSEFGTSDAENGCNEYIRENYAGYSTFNDYECTEDCSGHQAGYDWAEDNGIETEDDCGGNSDSFIEGCMSYVEENY